MLFDLILKGGNVFDHTAGTFTKTDVAIQGDRIYGLGSFDEGRRIIDCTDKYVLPGLIDAHLHIESSLLSPAELSKVLLQAGTTTIIADPHEIVNVCGSTGLSYFLREAERSPVNIFLMLPSSVPATPFDTNGAGEWLAEDMKPFLRHPRVLGLGEMMCFPDVIRGDEKALDKIRLFAGRPIDGHAPGLSGEALLTYKQAGILTEHECSSYAEAKEKLDAGFFILMREGSGARNLSAILSSAIRNGDPLDRFAFCTDDKHLEDIRREGHVSFCVKKAVREGLSPADAVRLATLSPASIYGLNDLGRIASGCLADLLVVRDVADMSVETVIKSGTVADGAFLASVRAGECDASVLDTVKPGQIDASRLAVKRRSKNHVIGMVKHQLLTEDLYEEIPGEGDAFLPDAVYSKLVTAERHGKNGNVAAAPVKGFGIRGGAVATSVSHDSHNITAVGDNDADIIAAIRCVTEMRGGYAVVSGGKVTAKLPLPIAGLMSDADAESVMRDTRRVLDAAHALGIPDDIDPITNLAFTALPVIPSLRLLDTGLFDARTMQFVTEE